METVFSIIIPVYNAEIFLSSCLDSILKQTFQSYEVLLIDDGSEDKSGEICDAYAERYLGFQVYHQENSGVSAARNAGIHKAKGKYIVFLDADDFIEKELLMKVYNEMEDQGYDTCSFAVRCVDEEKHFLYEMRYEGMTKALSLSDCSIDDFLLKHFLQYEAGWEACFYIYRSEILHQHHIRFNENLSYAEDMVFTFEYMLYITKWIKIPDILYNYTKRNHSVTGRKEIKQMMRHIFTDVFVCIRELLQKKTSKKYTEQEISIFLAAMIKYFLPILKREWKLSEIRAALLEYQELAGEWELLLPQKKKLCQIFGKTEGNQLFCFIRYVTGGRGGIEK